jgi:hypothetical protein
VRARVSCVCVCVWMCVYVCVCVCVRTHLGLATLKSTQGRTTDDRGSLVVV